MREIEREEEREVEGKKERGGGGREGGGEGGRGRMPERVYMCRSPQWSERVNSSLGTGVMAVVNCHVGVEAGSTLKCSAVSQGPL